MKRSQTQPRHSNRPSLFSPIITLTLLIALSFSAGLSAIPPSSPADGGKVFSFVVVSRDLDHFREQAELAATLKPYGRVQVNISTVADKSFYMVPKGGSPWHEYTSYNPTIFKFFPHPKIAPHIPAEDVKRNRELLLAKVKILRELGLEAMFWCYLPNYLPESFFVEYPHLRGPRVDHPRRSKEEAFAVCMDLPETQEMYEWMVAELKRNVPELNTLVFKTNDAGSGICWAAAQYSGPNGPTHCRGKGTGPRVRDLIETLQRGGRKHGGEVEVRIGGSNFWQNEVDLIVPLLPEGSHLDNRDRGYMGVGGMVNQTYPVQGILNPLSMIGSMERYQRPGIDHVAVSCRVSYDRNNEPAYMLSKVLEIMTDCMDEPVSGLQGRWAKLKKLSARWGGEANADRLFETFYNLDQAFRTQRIAAPRFRSMYAGVSMRLITRPIVLKPDWLRPEEEAYFLPHVFNIHENEGRMDLIDSHGGRLGVPDAWGSATSFRNGGLDGALSGFLRVARDLESFSDAPEAEWLKKIALGLRMHVCVMRSINNCYFSQIIRDLNADLLAGEPRIPLKEGNWFGDKYILEWNRIMREELDNSVELVGLLESGGLAQFSHAADARHQDTFVLGPDIAGDLKKKIKIMRDHWLDVEEYMATPHK